MKIFGFDKDSFESLSSFREIGVLIRTMSAKDEKVDLNSKKDKRYDGEIFFRKVTWHGHHWFLTEKEAQDALMIFLKKKILEHEDRIGWYKKHMKRLEEEKNGKG